MSLVLISPPATEPVSLAEAKAHLRVDTATDDMVIASLLVTARLQIEAALSLALMTQTWTYVVDRTPDSATHLTVTIGPIRQILAARLRSPDGSQASLPLDRFTIDGAARPPRIGLPPLSRDAHADHSRSRLEFDLMTGFGDAPEDVPSPIRLAIKLLTAHWYEHRALAEAPDAGRIPDAISALLAPWSPLRLV